jgi:ribonuclease D
MDPDFRSILAKLRGLYEVCRVQSTRTIIRLDVTFTEISSHNGQLVMLQLSADRTIDLDYPGFPIRLRLR